jgi:putative redox protein
VHRAEANVVIQATSQAGAYQTEFSNRQARALADAPVHKGGGGAGFGPHELLEAALATCINIAVRMRAEKLGIALDGVSTTVQLNRSPVDKVAFECTTVYGGSLSAEDREQLNEAANTCPVRQTLSKKIEFTAHPDRMESIGES